MKKWIERVVILVLVVGSVAAAYAYGIHRQNVAEQQRIEEQEQRQREQLYYIQNTYFHITGLDGVTLDEEREYHSYSAITQQNAKELYLDLVCYQLETGNVVTLKDVEEYLSQQYEEDGTLRLYNNGQHEKIKHFIEWSAKIGSFAGAKIDFRRTVLSDCQWAYIEEHYPDPVDRTDARLNAALDTYDRMTLEELQAFVEEHYLPG